MLATNSRRFVNVEGRHLLYLNLAQDDLNSFLPAWAAYRGVLATPRYVFNEEERKTHLALAPHLVGLFRRRNLIALEKEFVLKGVRMARYPECVSRISCIYAWPDETIARVAPLYWAAQGKHFSAEFLVEVGFWSERDPTVVDTRWIDKYIINSTTPLAQEGADWMDNYWKGEPFPYAGEKDLPQEPMWECLIDGMGLIWSREMQMKGFEIVSRIAPNCLGILEHGRLGADLCARFGEKDLWQFGQIVPFIVKDRQNGSPRVDHIMMNHKDDVMWAIAERMKGKIQKKEINWEALKQFKAGTQTLPDLRPLQVDLSWLSDKNPLEAHVLGVLTAMWVNLGGDMPAALERRNAELEQSQAAERT
jgi:hypothetical protein